MNKKILFLSVVLFGLLSASLFPISVRADACSDCISSCQRDEGRTAEWCRGGPCASDCSGGDPSGDGKGLTDLLDNLKTTFISIGAAVVVIGWIFTGILYLTSAGKPEKMNVAKTAIIACVIGTLLIILADAAGTISSVVKSAFGL